MLGRASTSIIRKIICKFVAPKLRAASITPLSTSFNAFSMIRTIKGAAPMLSGTIAALAPILLPIKNCVKGNKTTIKIKKGKERKVLVTLSRILYIMAFGLSPFGAQSTNAIPGMIASSVAIKVATMLIYKVSIVASSNK